MATVRLAYKCSVSASYILNNASTEIDANYIKYILIENLYEERTMPVIYLSLSIPSDLYTKMVDNEKKGKFYLNIQKYNAYSDTAISKNAIKGQFTYIMSTSNPNYSKELDTANENADIAYRKCTLALLSMELMNKAKTSFNGIFADIDENTIITKTLEGLDAVVKAPLYNAKFETEVIPPVTTRKQLLDYVFNQSPFYDTAFTFFLDFDKTFLVDRNGEGCKLKTSTPNSIIYNIAAVTDTTSYIEGMEVKNNAYYLNINPANTNITLNKGQDKVANQIISVSEDGTVEATDLKVNNNYDSTTKQKFIRGTTSTLYKNAMESNSIIIDIKKDNIDGSIFTPDKIFNISNYSEYKNYDGTYSMVSRKEIINNINGNFTISTIVKLRKIGNITSIGGAVAAAATKMSNGVYSYVSGGDTKTTTNVSSKSNKSTTTTDGNPYSGNKSSIVNSVKARNILLATGNPKYNYLKNAVDHLDYKSVATSGFLNKNVDYSNTAPTKIVIARSEKDSLKRKFK